MTRAAIINRSTGPLESLPLAASASAALAAGLKSTLITPGMFASLARASETAGLIAALALAGRVCGPATGISNVSQTFLGPVLLALIATAVWQAFGLYTTAALNAPLRAAGSLVLGWTIAAVAVIAGMFAIKSGDGFGGAGFVLWYGAGLAAIGVCRALLLVATRSARRAGYLTRNAIIYGTGGSSDALIAQLRNDPNSDVRLCGVFDDRGDVRAASTASDIPCLGNIETLKAFARSGRVDMLIMALPLAAEQRVTTLVHRLAELPIDVRLAATASTLRFRPSAYSYVGSVPMIDLSDRPIAGWSGIVKWLVDKTLATLAIIALAPVMVLVAAAVKCESAGSVLFRQKRYGFNNELIEVYKFRSMYIDRADANAARLVSKDDPRVTRVGRFIRKASLDELPQLFNVMMGTLSLVGPRPHAMQAKAADQLYPDVVDSYFARHRVKPGITGWAQINGWRGETDTPNKIQKRIAYDLDYIDNWSVWFDLYILAKTPRALLQTENAY